MPIEETVLKCFREACTNSASVRGYNRVTHGLYCKKCAITIHRNDESVNMFPLLFSGRPAAGGSYRPGLILVRETQLKEQS